MTPPGSDRPASRVRTVVEVVAIDDVERNRSALEAECFAEREVLELSGRRIQSTAGFLAVKRALVRLLGCAGNSRGPAERSFVLGHVRSGALRVVDAPALSDGPADIRDALRVSVSHTRQFAYGLAAVEEETGG